MKEEAKQILEIVTDMQDQMSGMQNQMSGLATKEDMTQLGSDLRQEMREMERRLMAEIRDIRTELDYLLATRESQKTSNASFYDRARDVNIGLIPRGFAPEIGDHREHILALPRD